MAETRPGRAGGVDGKENSRKPTSKMLVLPQCKPPDWPQGHFP
jgi:hypothetical protein